ncbi:MAG: ABC transporter permease [Candidatus Aenigmatarchaeota archaeon]
MISDYFSFSLRTLRYRRLRSWLTILGIFIGIAAVIGLISISQGMNEAIAQQFELLGTDTITIMPGKFGAGPPGFGAADFTEDDVDVIKGVRGVDTVVPMIFRMQEVKYRGESKYTWVTGTPAKQVEEVFFDIQGLHIEKGRLPSESDTYGLVAGTSVQDELFENNVNIGDRIEIAGKTFKVRGFLSEVGNPQDDNSLWIHMDTAREVFDEPDEVSFISLNVKSGADVDKVADEIAEELEDVRGQDDFSVLTTTQISESVSNVLGIVQLVFVGIASIALLVGGVGIMNTMYTSVMERTKEIGVMKAVGATNSDIMFIFVFESGILGLVGGIIGVILGLSLSLGIEVIAAEAGYGILKASITPELIAFGLGFSFLIGVASGVLPARRAAGMNPVDALRYE